MPSMVRDDSAMFVATTILRPAGPPAKAGGGACTRNAQRQGAEFQHMQVSQLSAATD
jgi:hypothetical protein